MQSMRSILPRGGALAAALALAVGAPVSAQLIPAGAELTLDRAAKGTIAAPAAVFSDGQAVVLWEKAYVGVSGGRFAPTGTAVAPAAVLASSQVPDQLPFEGEVTFQKEPAVALLDSGLLVTVWTEERHHMRADVFFQETKLLGSRIVARRFDRDGRPAGPLVQVSGDEGAPVSAPRITRLADGRLAVTWHAGQGSERQGVFARILGRWGGPRGPVIRVDEEVGGPGVRPVVAAAGDGFLVAWQGCCDAGGDEGIFARLFDARGAAAGSAFPVTGAGEQVWPTVAAGPAGEHLLAWMGPGEPGSELEYQVYGRILGGDGTLLGDEMSLSSGAGRAHGAPTVVAAGDGYVVAWIHWGRHFPVGVHAVATSAAGQPVGEPVRVNSKAVGFQWRLSLVPDDQGRVLALWSGYDEDGNRAIKARLIASGATEGTRSAGMASAPGG